MDRNADVCGYKFKFLFLNSGEKISECVYKATDSVTNIIY